MRSLLLELPYYIAWSVGIFSVGAVFGAGILFVDQEFTKLMLRDLGNFASDAMSGTAWDSFIFIFINNTVKALAAMVFGILFAVAPVLFLLVNGFVLGLVFTVSLMSIGLLVFGASIVPHGIFELPALFISSAMGLLLGIHLIKRIRRETEVSVTVPLMLSTQLFAIVVVPLLLVAAVIEVYVTPLVVTALIG